MLIFQKKLLFVFLRGRFEINEAFFVYKRGGISFSGPKLVSAQKGHFLPRIPLSGQKGSLYAPKVERLFERGVSALDAEWRAQFPDDATYVSEMSKKEYPSEANAVMRAATRGDEKEKRALPKKGARAD